MKWQRKVVVLLALTSAMVVAFVVNPRSSARRTADATRRTLREQGMKLEFKDFERTNSPQARSSLQRLILAGYANSDIFHENPRISRPVGTNALVVVWSQPRLPGWQTDDLWPALRQKVEERRAALDDACAAAMAGPITCELGVLWNGELMNTNLAAFKALTFALTYRMLLELHDGNRDAAWTNLMAVTRLVTAWDIEPIELSHMARMANMVTAELATWQAMQNKTWTDRQLAALQHEWDSLKLFDNLNETAAAAGANAVMACRLARTERKQSENSMKLRRTATELLRSPRAGWHAMVSDYRDLVWRKQGSFEYENALMLYFGKRENEIKRAISAQSWLDMRALPGVTNVTPLPTNSRPVSVAFSLGSQVGSRGLVGMLLGRSAMCEAKRRLLVTAIALERYRVENGAYPQTLAELRPKFLTNPPIDFMDGKPLRYFITNGGFVLYSVGLDCADQGGDMTQIKHWHEENGTRLYSRGPENDVVWPRSAIPGEPENE